MRNKNYFLSVLFFLAGIISLLRGEGIELIVSVLFSALFLITNIVIKEQAKEAVLEQQQLY